MIFTLCTCSIHDQEELAATELQIREFGQTPRRLFVLAHPARLTAHGKPAQVLDEEVRTVGATTEGLSRMDSSSSYTQLTPMGEEKEWVYIDMPGDDGMYIGIYVHTCLCTCDVGLFSIQEIVWTRVNTDILSHSDTGCKFTKSTHISFTRECSIVVCLELYLVSDWPVMERCCFLFLMVSKI